MKIKITFFVLLFALSFLAKAQQGIGVSYYYNLGNNYESRDEQQIGFGITASKQLSNYFATEARLMGIFYKVSNFRNPVYEAIPSTLEVSYLVCLRPIGNHNKVRLTLGTGFAYRYFFSSLTGTKRLISAPPKLNNVVGVPIIGSAEIDISDRLTLGFVEENQFFPKPANQFIGGDQPFLFYYGIGLNLVYRLFPKK